MKFHNENIDIVIPDGAEQEAALCRTTHLGIGAHHDDLEIMTLHGILECFGSDSNWFTGVTCTDGAGSPRTGVYECYTDEDMKRVRMEEQRTAARIGRYSSMIQLLYASKEIKDPGDTHLQDDLEKILKIAKPETVYTHNPADKHSTHVAVFIAAIQAIRRLPRDERPTKVYGCEVWRGLDWVPDERKTVLDVSGRDHLMSSLTGVYDSQIAGGKRYDLAMSGRCRANATYLDSHAVDTTEAAIYALDLTPLAADENIDISEYLASLVNDFRDSMEREFNKLSGQ